MDRGKDLRLAGEQSKAGQGLRGDSQFVSSYDTSGNDKADGAQIGLRAIIRHSLTASTMSIVVAEVISFFAFIGPYFTSIEMGMPRIAE